ncbi:membrane protein insertase YidC [Pseudoxanthobacter sp.]|uniref:membrane protein insertase YidC n=1 Tax=Pseudoxanthobacter sp. TaxID=1925742 RepID=UPI002FE3E742
MTENKNVLIAIALSFLVIVGWQFFYAGPKEEAARKAAQIEASQKPKEASTAPTPGARGASGVPSEGGAATGSREAVLASSPRAVIDTPAIIGSVNLKGARLDDIRLKGYRETVSPTSPLITLFSPSGAPDAYYAEFGFVGDAGARLALPGPDTLWTAEGGEGAKLTPATPLVLTWDNGAGLTFRRTFTVDDHYMFKVVQSVTNSGKDPAVLYGYSLISRHGLPPTSGYYILHEGLLGVFGDEGLKEVKYKTLEEDGAIRPGTFKSGWLGITDKYWAATLIPQDGKPFQPSFNYFNKDGHQSFQADVLGDAISLAPGASADVETRLFAGAKVVSVIDNYQDTLKLNRFDLLIDWGWFYFLTKPMFFVIDFFYKLVGNFGVAILLVTVSVKLIFFPLANKSYVSMSKMKLIQPELTAMRERYKDDRVKQQQAMMELYKKEKINPLAGCLPIAIQIPVFFSLYKVLFITIEMRHAPFFGWIHDLAAPDPTTIFNLFGLIPWTPPHFLMIGVWPIIMGITMFLQMKLNPTPPDPAQAMVFNWMPVIFTFMLGGFPAGLVIYWAWNNTLSVAQQSFIMHRQGVKVELWGNVLGTFQRKAKGDQPAGTASGKGTPGKSGSAKPK